MIYVIGKMDLRKREIKSPQTLPHLTYTILLNNLTHKTQKLIRFTIDNYTCFVDGKPASSRNKRTLASKLACPAIFIL